MSFQNESLMATNLIKKLEDFKHHEDDNLYDYIKNCFANWTSKSEEIDKFIQEMQLKLYSKFNFYDYIVLEWIPYSQFNGIKEKAKNNFAIVYSAIWVSGPLHYQHNKFTRDSNKEVALKCLHNSQNPIEFVINEV